VEEKLLVDRYEKRMDVPNRVKGTAQRYGSRCRRSAEVRRLANLARRFVLSVGVGVRLRPGHQQKDQDRQSQRKKPDPFRSRLVPRTHLDTAAHYSNL
jgi:hypothetical protein